ALADQLLTNILSNVDKRDRTSSVYRRLFGTNTPEGAVNIVPELLSPMYKNYYLKGRAGTGKSTLMKRIVAACKDYGLDLELYHCSFDPDSIDMVIIHEDRKSTRLNSSHVSISYAVFCLKKKNKIV